MRRVGKKFNAAFVVVGIAATPSSLSPLRQQPANTNTRTHARTLSLPRVPGRSLCRPPLPRALSASLLLWWGLLVLTTDTRIVQPPAYVRTRACCAVCVVTCELVACFVLSIELSSSCAFCIVELADTNLNWCASVWCGLLLVRVCLSNHGSWRLARGRFNYGEHIDAARRD